MTLLNSRPLVRRGDKTLFVAHRQEEATLLRAIDDGLNCVVTGTAGTGKTSLISQIAWASVERGADVYKVSLASVAEVASAAEVIAESVVGPAQVRETPAWERSMRGEGILGRLQDKPTSLGRVITSLNRLRYDLEEDQSASTDDAFEARPANDLEPIIFLDSVAPKLAASLFTEHADQLAEVPAQWIVAVSRNDSMPAVNPAPRFFDCHVNLGRLSTEDLLNVVASRAGVDTETVRRLVDDAEGLSLRDAIAVARDYAGHSTNARQLRDRRLEAERRLHAIGRAAAMLVAEMRSRGPVSASDEELLSAMGWKRARASEVLSGLSKAGLVTFTEQVGPGGGRPRRLYDLVEELK